MKKPQIIIPMSGIGKRFIDAGYLDPKPLIEVDGYPIIEHVVNLFGRPDNVIFICNEVHLKETDMTKILKRISPNCKIYPVSNENRRGPVHAISQIFDKVDDDKEIIVSYCDYGTKWNYEKFLKETRERNAYGAIPCYTGFHPHMLGGDNYAFVKMVGDTAVEIQEKKPFTDDKMSELASNGTYYFKNGKIVKKYFKELITKDINLNGEYYVSLVYKLLMEDNLLVTTFLIDKMLQWGTPNDLEIYNSWSRYFNNLTIKQERVFNPKNTTLILPMAGKGSRFEDEGYVLPKPMLDIDGKPMIIQSVDCLPKSDNNIFICLGEHIKNFGIDGTLEQTYKNCNVISLDETTEGQACTCKIGVEEGGVDLESPVLISACDNGVYYDSEKYLKLLNDENVDVIVWSFRNNQTSKNNPNAYAWLDVDDDGSVKHVSCKNFIYDDPLTTHAIIGTMFFRKAKYFIDGLDQNIIKNIRTNNEFYVDDVLNQNIASGLNVKVFEVVDYLCWGTPNDYKTYNYWESFFNDCTWHPYSNKRKIKEFIREDG
jgi:NDP-sugar pyrophosphorylase family protein